MKEICLLLVLCLLVLMILLIFAFIKLNSKKKKSSENLLVFNTLQDMFDAIGSDISVKEKLERLNNILKNSINAKYSSIVLYDGNNYEIGASNIEENFEEALFLLANEKIFKNNYLNKSSKYLVAEKDRDLSYKSSIERNIKSVIFTPIYYGNTYLGFWLVEDTKEHAFENILMEDLKILKNNISLFVENVQIQNTLEVAENTDKQTGFYNNMYLYSNARNILSSYDESSISVICLKNIPDINEKYGRNLGNTLILRVANVIKDIVSKTSIIVRYTGIRIVVITPGSNAQVTHKIMEKVLLKIKNEIEYIENDKVSIEAQVLIHTLKKQNNIEKEIQSMMSYLDYMNAVNTIKII